MGKFKLNIDTSGEGRFGAPFWRRYIGERARGDFAKSSIGRREYIAQGRRRRSPFAVQLLQPLVDERSMKSTVGHENE